MDSLTITYTHGEKEWRFIAQAEAHENTHTLTVADLAPCGYADALRTSVARALHAYLSMTPSERVIDTTKPTPLVHLLVRSVWGLFPTNTGRFPVAATWQNVEGEQRLFIPTAVTPEWDTLLNSEVVSIEWVEMALLQEDVFVRRVVATRIPFGNERLLMMALADNDAMVRWTAANRIPEDNERLIELALKDGDLDARLAAATCIPEDNERLLKIALKDEHRDVRWAAAKRIPSGNDRLLKIALNDDDAGVRREAAKSIPADNERLIELALADEDKDVQDAARRIIARAKLTDA